METIKYIIEIDTKEALKALKELEMALLNVKKAFGEFTNTKTWNIDKFVKK